MPRIGVVGQGSFDTAILPVLIRRLRPQVSVEPRQCGGPIPGKIGGIIKEFGARGIVDHVLIVSDAEREPPDVVIERIRNRLPPRTIVPITIVVAVQELEAWLVADPNAISRLTDIALKPIPNPEAIEHPKSQLERILFRASIRYTEKQGQELARLINPNVVAKRCPSFAAFRQAVMSVPGRRQSRSRKPAKRL